MTDTYDTYLREADLTGTYHSIPLVTIRDAAEDAASQDIGAWPADSEGKPLSAYPRDLEGRPACGWHYADRIRSIAARMGDAMPELDDDARDDVCAVWEGCYLRYMEAAIEADE